MTRASGFSLIEVMVSLTILAMALMAINSMQMTAVQGNINNYSFLEAIKVGSDATERLMAAAADDELLGANGAFHREKLDAIMEADTLAGLGGAFQFQGLTEASGLATSFSRGFDGAGDIHLWHGENRRLSQGSGQLVERNYTVRAVIDRDFSPGSGFATVFAARGLVTVFWQTASGVKHIDVPFFLGSL